MGENTFDTRSDSQSTTTTETSIVLLIHKAIAEREETEPSDCPPLFDVIDPDALNKLFAPTQAGTERHGKVIFEYYGYTVTVTEDRTVSLDPIAADDSRFDF